MHFIITVNILLLIIRYSFQIDYFRRQMLCYDAFNSYPTPITSMYSSLNYLSHSYSQLTNDNYYLDRSGIMRQVILNGHSGATRILCRTLRLIKLENFLVIIIINLSILFYKNDFSIRF